METIKVHLARMDICCILHCILTDKEHALWDCIVLIECRLIELDSIFSKKYPNTSGFSGTEQELAGS